MPIDALWGVGPVTATRLRAHGIEKLVDVRAIAVDDLRAIVGSLAPWLHQLARGMDERPVEPNREAKSASSENTFNRDLTDVDEIRLAVDEMARDVAAWLVRKQKRARTVTLKVRYEDFTTITRSVTVMPPTDEPAIVAARAVALLDRTEAGTRPVRLLGVGVHNLSGLDDEPPAPHPRGTATALRRRRILPVTNYELRTTRTKLRGCCALAAPQVKICDICLVTRNS